MPLLTSVLNTRTSTFLVFFCLALSLFAGSASAENRAVVMLDTWKADFRAGNAAAAYLIGYSYQQGGGGVWKNTAEAVRWYQLGARRGDLQAALALADMYLTGEGTSRDEEKAIYWYLRLGASNSSEYARPARTRLLMLTRNYAFGEGGVRRDERKAGELFTRIFKMEQEGQTEFIPEPLRTTASR